SSPPSLPSHLSPSSYHCSFFHLYLPNHWAHHRSWGIQKDSSSLPSQLPLELGVADFCCSWEWNLQSGWFCFFSPQNRIARGGKKMMANSGSIVSGRGGEENGWR
ncbi:hypothetical protein PENTCL1PPCAC_22326, partial [Pristionchus entomophagus]